MNKALRTMDDPAEKMAELESELERQDAERQKQEEPISKYAPKSGKEEENKEAQPVAAKVEEVKKSPPPLAKAEEKPVKPVEKEGVKPEKDEEPAKSASEPVQDKSGEEDHEDGEDHDQQAEPEPQDQDEDGKGAQKSSSALWWNISVVVCILLVGTMGYLFYEQNRTMPDDPLDRALSDKEMTRELYRKKKLEFNEVRIRDLKNQKLKTKNLELYELRQALGQKEKAIDDLQREMTSIRAQMKSYFGIYKDYARKKARNLQFDSLTTVKTKKTYLDVSIRQVGEKAVSIVHAGGATNLDPEDLSDALRNRLAFGDPLGLSEIDREKAEEEGKKKEVGKYLPAPETFDKQAPAPAPAQPSDPNAVDVDALLNQNFDPPSKLPNVETAPAAAKTPEQGF